MIKNVAHQPVNRARPTDASPAAPLWDNPSEPAPAAAPAANILLAPAVPLIIPAMNAYNAKDTETSEKPVSLYEKCTFKGFIYKLFIVTNNLKI